MINRKRTNPSICILTQTAEALSPYYQEFFAGLDLFFITYKQPNADAIDYLPKSTWSDGRNRLWEYVKGQYDYYLFIDDDLKFFELPTYIPNFLEEALYQTQRVTNIPPFSRLYNDRFAKIPYRQATPAGFEQSLMAKIQAFRPMIASFRTLSNPVVDFLDRYALNRNRRVRPTGWFDAQVTLFSHAAASFLLPYDTAFSGWWSSQIPIYCLSHLAFKERSIYILDIAAHNGIHTCYEEGYEGYRDILDMSEWLSKGILDTACEPLYFDSELNINFAFASGIAKAKAGVSSVPGESIETILRSLQPSFDLRHPYLYQRHSEVIDRLSL